MNHLVGIHSKLVYCFLSLMLNKILYVSVPHQSFHKQGSFTLAGTITVWLNRSDLYYKRTLSHPFHLTPLHITPLHCTPLHSTPLHCTPFELHSTPLHATPRHATPFHSTPLHSTPLHSAPPHPTALYSTPLHSKSKNIAIKLLLLHAKAPIGQAVVNTLLPAVVHFSVLKKYSGNRLLCTGSPKLPSYRNSWVLMAVVWSFYSFLILLCSPYLLF